MDKNQFAETIKQKYPAYKDVDNTVLADKMLAKYPEYASKVNVAPAPVAVPVNPILKAVFGEKSGVNLPKRTEQLSNFGKNTLQGIKTANLKQVGTGLLQGVSGVVGPVADTINQAVVGAATDVGQALSNTYKNTVPQSVRSAISSQASKAVNAPIYYGSSVKQIAKDTLQGSVKDFSRTSTAVAPEGSFASAAVGAANDVLNVFPLKGVAKKGLDVTKETLGAAVDTLPAAKNIFVNTPEKIVAKRVQELADIENNYVKTRKANSFKQDAGEASRKRVAETDVLVNAVDDTGTIRTVDAVKNYKAQTLDGAENVVRNNLERLGERVSLADVESKLKQAIEKSGLQGADLVTANNNIKKEIAGYRLKADEFGNVPLTLIHDAKISTTGGINFLTAPEIKTYRKAVARGLKETIEEKSKFNVKEVNSEIAKYLDDIALLERLDGKKVKGGKLGKYTAQLSGNLIGGAFGALGGPVGSSVGAVIGGELAGKIKGSMLSKTLGKATGYVAPKSKVIEKAVEDAKLPAAKPYLYNSGNLNKTYSTNNTPIKNVIPDSILPKNNLSSTQAKPLLDDFGNEIPLDNFANNQNVEEYLTNLAKKEDFNTRKNAINNKISEIKDGTIYGDKKTFDDYISSIYNGNDDLVRKLYNADKHSANGLQELLQGRAKVGKRQATKFEESQMARGERRDTRSKLGVNYDVIAEQLGYGQKQYDEGIDVYDFLQNVVERYSRDIDNFKSTQKDLSELRKAKVGIPKNPKIDVVDNLAEEAKKYKSGEDFYQLSGSKVNQALRDKGIRGQEQVTKYWEEITNQKSGDSYFMSHRPSKGLSLDNLEKKGGDTEMPENFVRDLEQYFPNGGEYGEATKESIKAVRALGKNNGMVTIYRASPKGEINSGDWVTLSKKYAELHKASNGGKISSIKVPAEEVHFAGDDINEFGYFPKSQLTDIYNKANKNTLPKSK